MNKAVGLLMFIDQRDSLYVPFNKLSTVILCCNIPRLVLCVFETDITEGSVNKCGEAWDCKQT